MRGFEAVVLVSIAALMAGCPSGGFGVRPEARNLADGGEGRDSITVTFELQDRDHSLISVRVEYSTDGGATWRAPTLLGPSAGDLSGNVVAGLRPGEAWTAYQVTWDSWADRVAVAGPAAVTVRLTPWDSDGEGARAEGAVTVDNHYAAADFVEGEVTLSFGVGGLSNPPDETLQVRNSGPSGTTLDWSLSISYGPEASGWLSASLYSGTTVSGDTTGVALSADIADMLPGTGTYTATVTVDDPLAHDSPRSIPVTLAVVPSADLVAYWRFDDWSGTTAVDSSGNGYHGTLQGEPTWTAGRATGALSFDGVDDYVDVPNSPDLGGGGFTFACWICRHADPAMAMVEKPGQFGLRVANDQRLVLEIVQANNTVGRAFGTTPIDTGAWSHVVAVADAGSLEMSIYIDGVKETLQSDPGWDGTVISQDTDINIGLNVTGALYWNGLIDDVRIYNRALSDAEVLALSQLGVSSVATWYVDDDAPGPVHDGLTWDTAFPHPQYAMDAAMPGSEIRVAEGTYVLRNPASETAVLTMHTGVAVYGGYAGYGASNPDERDPDTYVTTLDGEDVAYHVVTGASDATLDGFTVTRGDTGGVWGDPFGGGGMDNQGVTGLTVTNCTFTDNRGIYGGGMRNVGCSPLIADCAFEDNWANRGGGIHNYDSSPTIANCTFAANGAGMGGGMQNKEAASPTISNCTFAGNRANLAGGGMFNYLSSAPTIVNCTFVGNDAGMVGGAVTNRESANPTIVNCTFFANTADIGGGGIRSQDLSGGTAANCTFWGNAAPTGAQIYLVTGSTLDVTYSCVQGGWAGAGNIDADPLFIDAAAGDLRLQVDSPCIDTGTGLGAPADDLDGNPRPSGAGYDMGAYEFQGTSPDIYKVVNLATGVATDHASVPDLLTNVEYRTTKLVLRRVGAGTFQMGDEVGGHGADELPVHTVNITKPFYIGVFELTQKQWNAVTGAWPSYFTTNPEKRPVENVSWDDCQTYLTQLSALTGATFRLPTEAEWEYACKAGTSTNYSYGNTEDGAYMWYSANSGGETREVGTRLPNPLGIYDMHGNVVEWCRDWYAADYYASSPSDDPSGPASGTERVMRGGSWTTAAAGHRSSDRGYNLPTFCNSIVGLRVVFDP